MITAHDIEKVVKTAVDAQGAITGKSHPNRAPDEPDAYPYCVFYAVADDAEYNSGPTYHQKWTVRAEFFGVVGTTNLLDMQKAAMTALVVGAPPVVANLRNPGEKVMHALQITNGEDYDETVRDGRDVLVYTLNAQLYCQGDRSVA